jgi:hypothetical protein
MQERAPTLRYTYIACLVTSWYDKKDAVILNKIRNIRRLKIWELNPNINVTVVVVAFIPIEYHWVTSRLHVTEHYHPAWPLMDAEVLTTLAQKPTGRPYFTTIQILKNTFLGSTFSYNHPRPLYIKTCLVTLHVFFHKHATCVAEINLRDSRVLYYYTN